MGRVIANAPKMNGPWESGEGRVRIPPTQSAGGGGQGSVSRPLAARRLVPHAYGWSAVQAEAAYLVIERGQVIWLAPAMRQTGRVMVSESQPALRPGSIRMRHREPD